MIGMCDEKSTIEYVEKVVEPTGIEPVASSMSEKRSNHLSYGSTITVVLLVGFEPTTSVL